MRRRSSSLAEEGLRKNEALFVELKQKGDVREALSGFSKMVFSCLEQAQTECYTAPDMHRVKVRATLDPKAVAQVFISLLEGFVLQKALDPSVDSTNYLEALDAFLDCSFWQRS